MDSLWKEFEFYYGLIRSADSGFRRFSYDTIDWSQRLIELRGSRGVGKTTLLLQKAQELYQRRPRQVLYLSLDDPLFYRHTLSDAAREFYRMGGKWLFLDEVHKYPHHLGKADWSVEIKNIYDQLRELHIIYTGSSMLALQKGNGDLSRRKISYRLPGLSFREYLNFTGEGNFEPVTIQEILKHHERLAGQISKKIKILYHFRQYLKHGYYPYFKEGEEHYVMKMKQVISAILESDVPSISETGGEAVARMKMLLGVLASSVPFKPNLSEISRQLYITDLRTLYRYLSVLQEAELIKMIHAHKSGLKLLQKPEKIYLHHPNLMFAWPGLMPDTGTLRETFFLNQTSYLHRVNYSDVADFLVDGKFLFEIGGSNKKPSKNKSKPESAKVYYVLDDMEVGRMNYIPLWLFGFLY
ncbi:MAG: AAA family ATPase [Bacteroidia bacterium]|nr:AAA family ATPase [Bacteroidia bacterium]